MTLCNLNHAAIVHDAAGCPVCQMRKDVEGLLNQIEELKAQLDAARDVARQSRDYEHSRNFRL